MQTSTPLIKWIEDVVLCHKTESDTLTTWNLLVARNQVLEYDSTQTMQLVLELLRTIEQHHGVFVRRIFVLLMV
jgi:hypothetical protein